MKKIIKIGSIIRYRSIFSGKWKYCKIVKIEEEGNNKKLWGYWADNIEKIKSISKYLGYMNLKDVEVMESNPNSDILLR